MYTFIFFVLGAAMGSFSLVLAWRMHSKSDWVRGRSACDHCNTELQPFDLVPVLSWLWLRGRCRYCKKKLPYELLFAELLLGFFFAVSYVFWPFALTSILSWGAFGVWLLSLILMSALFWYDLRWYVLPTKLVYSVLACSVLFVALKVLSLGSDVLLPSLLAAGVLWGFFFLLHQVSRGKWIGFGDVRLAPALGLFAGGLLEVWLLVFTASVVGMLFALPSFVKKQRTFSSKIPFGPMLIIAAVFVVLFGQRVIDSLFSFRVI